MATPKNTLRGVGIVLGIVVTLASIVATASVTHDNAKTARIQAETNTERIQLLETKQARFEGMIDERTRNTAKRVDDIYSIVKDWKPNE